MSAKSIREIKVTTEEIESGKMIAFAAYLIFFLPLLIDEAKNNKFVMFHTEQAIVLVITSVAILILSIVPGQHQLLVD